MAEQSGAGAERLTEREEEVARPMAGGLTNGEIANELGIGFSTAKTHVSQVIAKLGVLTRDEAVREWRARHRFSRWARGLLAGASAGAAVKLSAGVTMVLIVLAVGAGFHSAFSADPAASIAAPPTATPTSEPGPHLEMRVLEIEADAIDTRIRIGFADSEEFGISLTTEVTGAEVRDASNGSHQPFRQQPEATGELSTVLTFPALEPGSEWRLIVPSVHVDGSSTARPANGWSVAFTVPEWPAGSTVRTIGESQPFGPWTVVVDEVAKSGERFIVRAHIEGMAGPDPMQGLTEPPWLRLELADGSFAAMDWALIFHGPDNNQIDAAFYDVEDWPARLRIERRTGFVAMSEPARVIDRGSPGNQTVPWDRGQFTPIEPQPTGGQRAWIASAAFDLTR